MLRQDLSERSRELRDARVPFVHARVVLAERPTSAKPGDEAIVLPDGTIEGFVGGECAEATVRSQSLDLLRSGETALLRITPEPEDDQPGKRVVHNACLSGGTLEVFLEPLVPPPLVQVVGRSPVAKALAALGRPLGWAVIPFDGRVEPDATAVIVASHGRAEEAALEAALEAGVPYVGLVASKKRGQAVVERLAVSDDLRGQVHTPAGLDIGAATAPEVALSILAEVVTARPRAPRPPAVALTPPATATDPVCQMAVVADEDALHLTHEGQVVWFCGRGCLEAFAADPGAYPPALDPA